MAKDVMKLYKYVPCKYLEDILKKQHLRLDDGSNFNDPFELQIINKSMGSFEKLKGLHTYKDSWITDELSKEMILDVDKSEVLGCKLIQSPVLGQISPLQLSGGVKTLILIYKDTGNVFNASKCGDNCAKWLLKIAEKKEMSGKKVEINLRHIMNFGDGDFKIRIKNNGKIAHNMRELVLFAGEYV